MVREAFATDCVSSPPYPFSSATIPQFCPGVCMSVLLIRFCWVLVSTALEASVTRTMYTSESTSATERPGLEMWTSNSLVDHITGRFPLVQPGVTQPLCCKAIAQDLHCKAHQTRL